jgi:hypothetical protein
VNDENWQLEVTEFVNQAGIDYLYTVICRYFVDLLIVELVIRTVCGPHIARSPLTGHTFA